MSEADHTSDWLFNAEEFADRVALVTGGTDGLGEHLVRTLVELNCHTFFCGRRAELGEALEAELGTHAYYVQADVAEPEQIEALVRRAAGLRGQLDYLVNNVATDPRISLEDGDAEAFDRVIAVDLRSCYLVTRAALPLLRAGQGKAIVNIGTTNYLFGNAGMTLYSAAKAGIYGFTRSLARELGPAGIRANLLSPGWIATQRQLRDYLDEEAQADLLRNQCIKEVITPAHVTPVTLFLLSCAARALSGQNIVVDGGYYLH